MSEKRRDKRRKSPRPREESLDRRPVVLIVCEGQNTEPEYFEGLIAQCDNPRVRILPLKAQGVPLTIVQTAWENKERADELALKRDDETLAYEAVWCVFDRDDHPDIPTAYSLANAKSLRIAFSNPCFELWLLLHFREQPGMKHRDAVASLLKAEVTAYDKRKKKIDIAKFIAGYPDAVRRAKRLCADFDDRSVWDRNPYTDVHILTDLITAPPPEAPEADPEPAE